VPKLDEHLKSADFFDAAKYPDITFKSTKVEKVGASGLKIVGNLTIHGVTKPVTLNAKINKIGENPMMKKASAGFDATTTIKRSEFGVDKYVPNVSDEIPVRITFDSHAAQ
jgi:polyisoprenoid-binding protein YceI